VASDFRVEVFDWNQIEQAKSLGSASINLADIEPFEASERILDLSHAKHGNKGHVRVSLLFQPEIIARTRTKTSTFSTAGRAVTQVGGLPLAGGREVVHGVGKVGSGIGNLFKRDHRSEAPLAPAPALEEEPPAGQASIPVPPLEAPATAPAASANFPSTNGRMSPGDANEPGTLRVTVLDAKDLLPADTKPYVVLRVGDREYKTKHQRMPSPQW
jgi:Ca2+-dependent lipid-binding protein